MSLVVSDTSPIRALKQIAKLNLLESLYGLVLVPPAVAQELMSPAGSFSPIDLRTVSFIRIKAPADAREVEFYRSTLDPGESEAIVLAQETGSVLLIDEAAGRAAAAAAGISYIGVLGILGRAKGEGLIGPVRPWIDQLRGEVKFRVSDTLYEQFLRSLGEW